MVFRVVWDRLEPCPYLEGESARLPLRMPARVLTGPEFDAALAAGDRRTGRMLYRTQCPACTACEPLRVPVARFAPTRTQERAWRRNTDVDLIVRSPPLANEARVELFNRHKQERGLARTDEPMSLEAYTAWMVDTCVDTREFAYYVGERLVAVSILDVGARSVSSVYHYFDPDEARRSLGVYSVLREIAWCAEMGLEWYYLGLYVRDCSHLAYKANYRPHERRVAGAWVPGD